MKKGYIFVLLIIVYSFVLQFLPVFYIIQYFKITFIIIIIIIIIIHWFIKTNILLFIVYITIFYSSLFFRCISYSENVEWNPLFVEVGFFHLYTHHVQCSPNRNALIKTKKLIQVNQYIRVTMPHLRNLHIHNNNNNNNNNNNDNDFFICQ